MYSAATSYPLLRAHWTLRQFKQIPRVWLIFNVLPKSPCQFYEGAQFSGDLYLIPSGCWLYPCSKMVNMSTETRIFAFCDIHSKL